MAADQARKIQEFEYKAEMKQLLHLIVHSLYTHPEIFLRELISNASDALNKIRFRLLTDRNVLDPDADLKITVTLDAKEHTFAITDTGIGMTREDLIDKIGTVASSGTLEFLQKVQQENRTLDGNLIGRFGVGFYSVFMVAEEVTIETRHADPDSKGWRWRSGGEGTFTIEEIDKPNRGTHISFKLREQAKEFSEEYTVRRIINKYSNFVDFPIYLGKEKVNTVAALWHKPKEQVREEELIEFYKFISNDYNPPLGHLHLAVEGAVTFNALVFIPETAPPLWFRDPHERSLHLYSNKVFIQDDCKELLPDYLRFVKGVVDTADLPLNVSRELTQSSPAMAKIRDILTKKILAFLADWAKQEKPKFDRFYRNFGPFFKTGVNTDYANRDKIIELLRYESTRLERGELTGLRDYVSRMKPEQKAIYYLSGESREAVEKNPKLEYFRKHAIEVLLLTDPVDLFVLPALHEYDKKPLLSIDKADLELAGDQAGEQEALSGDLAKSLLTVFRETLGDKVEDVVASKRLVNSPVTLVAGKNGLDSQMEKMMKLMDQNYTAAKRILEVNLSHPLIKNLSRRNLSSPTDPILRKSILQLYEGALLLEGTMPSPADFVNRMNELLEEATK
ncbi:MAG: molecular chaperone HtpG [candidate division KSB1 bacterium]|nr:molecular chaperone HtpG [candidate division KSB1 bacterium]MDZ7275002.1 molecular chaperone HtpG [candidate division KSB1 bacterium]MDZ7286549.1 molecular chaperone HtpG [candidate division KSB1 bacterium]MDZ7299287.1 molecular chaperone HtpG [candidate division KSB1 bacterium]MDZ7307374.1 molecular chaperone HtpG [candidate division KSB1 bacterium]